MRHVFSNSELVHEWAHKTQAWGRSSGGSMFFENGTIFSYGYHFPMARHVQNMRGHRAVLFTTQYYSVTTSHHLSITRRAIPYGTPVFNVTNPEKEDHEENIRNYLLQIAEYILSAKRARKYKERNLESARGTKAELDRYCFFFGLEAPAIDLPEISDEAIAQVRAAEELCQQREEEKRMRVLAHTIATWRSGGATFAGLGNIPVMLRLKDGLVQTSHGAHVSIEAGLKAIAFAERAHKYGEAWKAAGEEVAIDGFFLREVGADGSLRIGCHRIAWKELERFAPVLRKYVLNNSGDLT